MTDPIRTAVETARVQARAIIILKTRAGRWLIVLPAAHNWAWAGSRFVEHRDGISRAGEGHAMSFATEQEALDYAVQHVIAKTKKEAQ